MERGDPRAGALERRRRSRRRVASLCFLAAGAAFGTALYLLRVRFSLLAAPRPRAAFFALVAGMVLLFWLGSRIESEVTQLDDELRALRDEKAAALRRNKPPG